MIPTEAVHAATDAMQQFALIEDRDGLQAWEAYAKIALEAAAPHMLAAWEAERNLEYKADEARREWLDDKEVEL